MTQRVPSLRLVIRTLLASGAVWATVAMVHAASVWSDAVRRGRAPTLASLVDGYLVAYAPWVPFAAALFPLQRTASDSASGAEQNPARWSMGSSRAPWLLLLVNGLFLAVELAYQAALLQEWSMLTVGSILRGVRDMPALFKLIDVALLLSTNAVVFTMVAMQRQRALIETQRSLQADRLRLQLSLEQQRLQGLRAQLEPHFLYNALNAISGLVRNDDRRTALTALQQLSRLLRYATEAVNKEWVTLTDEVAFLDEYLALQQLRFGTRLVVHRDGMENIPAPQECLPLLLQPLAENAIRHGVETSDEPTALTIRYTRSGDRTAICVSNTVPADTMPNPGLGVGSCSANACWRHMATRQRCIRSPAPVATKRYSRSLRSTMGTSRMLQPPGESLPSIRALIVDDEPLARVNLQCALESHAHWQVVHSCTDAASAWTVIQADVPDVVFLDIRMPRVSGLVLARRLLEFAVPPLVVFVTAYEAHAVEAFELHAIDYVIKPFDDARLAICLQRIEQLLLLRAKATYGEAMRGFLDDVSEAAEFTSPGPVGARPTSYLRQFCVKSVGRIDLVRVGDVKWIRAAGNYVELHLAKRMVLHRVTLATLAVRLDPAEFIRVHRRVIVRSEECRALTHTGDGTYELRLHGGVTVPVSERYVGSVRARMADR